MQGCKVPVITSFYLTYIIGTILTTYYVVVVLFLYYLYIGHLLLRFTVTADFFFNELCTCYFSMDHLRYRFSVTANISLFLFSKQAGYNAAFKIYIIVDQ